MFRCDGCGRKVGPRAPRHTIITKTRKVLYRNELRDALTREVTEIHSTGFEPVQEMRVGDCCLPALQGGKA
jgi:hypothetical protein